MSSNWGNNIKLSIFGESHGNAIGVSIDGLPSGIELDFEKIKFEMDRRAPGRDKTTTARSEKDEFQILSGYFNNRTTGTPLCMMISNEDVKSKDYNKNVARPGHADYTGHIKYYGYNDYRGGGHFSGRITAPLVFAGAIAKQILELYNIRIGSHIKSIGEIKDISFNPINIDNNLLNDLRNKKIPTIDNGKALEMEDLILEVKKEMDSVGGIIEVCAINLVSGLGSPFFDSVESKLSQVIFSIPGVKGIEFGEGFEISKMKGSEANDEFYIENNIVKAYTNNNGGILGGITSGMPLVFRVAFKPTPSIAKSQRTIDIERKENIEVGIVGRHDPCIAIRAVPVVEAATAIVLLDLIMERNMYNNFR